MTRSYAGAFALVLATLAQAAPVRAQEEAPAPKSAAAAATMAADSTVPQGAVLRAIAARDEGDAAAIAITVTGGGRFSLSEPFHSSSGVRLYVNIAEARVAPALALIPLDGVRITTDQRDDGVRIAIEVDGLGRYALEPTGDGAVLRIHAPDAAADFAAAFAPRPASPARERLAGIALKTTDGIASAAGAVRDEIVRWRITPLQVGSIVTIVLTPVVLLGIQRRRRTPRTAPAETRPTADTRLWAARTLAKGGATAAEISERTGMAREAAALLLRRASG
jgi:hypothetical protein